VEIPEHIRQIQILIIDDAASMRNITKTILRDAGFVNMEEADDGVNGLKKLENKHYDFVICDWTMPNMDGLELLNIVRKSDKLKSIPFLMATAVADAKNVKIAIQHGVTDYIAKPFAPELLCKKIMTALAKSNLKSEPA